MLFRGRGRGATLGFARDLGLGRHLKRRDVELHRVEELVVAAPPELQVQIDGDVVSGRSPLAISLAKDRLWVLAPRPTDRAVRAPGV